MVKWQDMSGGFSLAIVKNNESAEDAIIELCERIANYVIPKNEKVHWDHLRVEFWPDSGRIIVFPASLATNNRVEQAGCQVVFEELLRRYAELADSNIADDEFTAKVLSEERTWIDRFVNAARNTGLRGLRAVFWDAEDEQPILDVLL